MKENSLYNDLLNEGGHLNEEGLAFYADALQLGNTEELPRFITSHVEDCTICRSGVFEVYKMLLNLSKRQPLENHPFIDKPGQQENTGQRKGPPGGRSKPFPSSYLIRIAASIIVLIGLGFPLYLWVSQSINHNRSHSDARGKESSAVINSRIHEEDSLESIYLTSHKTIKASGPGYEVNNNLESMLDDIQGIAGVTVSSPARLLVSDTTTNIMFSWSSEPRNRLFLKIFDNRKTEIFLTEVRGKGYIFYNRLKPGLYYWTIFSGDEVAGGGKIIIQ